MGYIYRLYDFLGDTRLQAEFQHLYTALQDGQNNIKINQLEVSTVLLTDNLATALDIKEASTSYLKFVTTNGSESITLGKKLIATTESMQIECSSANVSNPPTDAELDSIFGTPSVAGAGFIGFVNDNGGGTNFYVIAADGTNWWQASLTKAL